MGVCDNRFCKKCGLHTNSLNPCIMGRGNKESGVLVIGDFLTRFEDKHNNVFLGKHGDFVQKRLDMVGLDCYFTNAIKCPLPTEKKESSPIQRSSCKPFTIKVIEEMKPKVIITLGQVALNQLIGMNFSTKVLRGRPFFFPEFNCFIVPTYQPKGIIYEADSLTFGQFRQDLELAKSILARPPKRKVVPFLRSLSEPEEIADYLRSLLLADDVVIDLETTGLDSRLSLITDISLSSKPNEGIHIKWEDLLPHSDLFRGFLESPVDKCFHNAAFDREMLFMAGFTKIPNISFDTMLAFHTTNMSFEGKEQQGLYKLKTMAWFMSTSGGYESVLDAEGGIAGVQGIKVKKEVKPPKLPYFWVNEVTKTFGEVKTKKALAELIKVDKACREVPQEEYETFKKEHTPAPVFNRLNRIPQVSLDDYNDLVDKRRMERMNKTGLSGLPYYAAMDALVTREAMNKIKPEIDNQYNNLFYKHIMPLNYVLSRMRVNGIRLDRDYMLKVKEENMIQAEDVKQEFFKSVGKEINMNSNPELHELLFKHLKIKPHPDFISKSTKKPSANEAAIDYYAEKHPEIRGILDYRGLMKATSTYIDGFMGNIHPLTGRVHPSYLQNSTATGRLSCIAEGTTISCVGEVKNIEDMKIGDLVYCYDDQGALRISKVKNVYNNGTQECVRINWQSSGNGSTGYLVCTPDHKIKTKYNGWVEAKDLKRYDKIFHLRKSIDKNKDGVRLYGTNSIMEWEHQFIKKDYFKAASKEHIHHIDENRLNNKIYNLIIMTPKEHASHHFNIMRKDGRIKPSHKRFCFTTGKDHHCYKHHSEEQLISYIHNAKGNLSSIKEVEGKTFVKKCKEYGIDYIAIADTYSASGLHITRELLEETLLAQKEYIESHQGLKEPLWKVSKILHIDIKKVYRLIEYYGISINHAVTKVYPIGEYRVYDLEIEDHHNFIANELCVHNCIGPALQTIPKDNKIRNMVVPTEGWKLVSADLSQAELRVLAELSNDEAMIAAFLSGKDLHAVTACNALLNIPIEHFDKKIAAHADARNISKIINFGIVYGMSSYTLAIRLNMPMETEEQKKKSMQTAQVYIDKWFSLYNGAKAWLDGIEGYCKQTGYVESLFGRRRYLHDIWSSDQFKSAGAGRQAKNTPIQSTASDITCMGLIRMQNFLDENPKYRAMIVGVIHDDILVDTPDEEIEDISKKLVECMTQNIPGMHIPLVADPSVHERWTKE